MAEPIHIPRVVPRPGIDQVNVPATPHEPGQGPSFADTLMAAMREVDSLQRQSNEMKENLVVDPNANLQDVMIATEEARVAFEFTMQVRNKVVQAYEELMRLQI